MAHVTLCSPVLHSSAFVTFFDVYHTVLYIYVHNYSIVPTGEEIPIPQDPDNKIPGDKPEPNVSTHYRLRGVVVHSGQASGGHYYSFIRMRWGGREGEEGEGKGGGRRGRREGEKR